MVSFGSQKDTSKFNAEIIGGRETRQEAIAVIHMRSFGVFNWGSSCKNGEADILRSVYHRMPLRELKSGGGGIQNDTPVSRLSN